MKLLSKTILYYFFISLPLLLIAGWLSYGLIRNEVRDGTDETLLREKRNIETVLKSNPDLELIYFSADSISSVQVVMKCEPSDLFSDSIIYDKVEAELVNYRFLKSYYSINGKSYLITIAKPTFEEEELIEGLLSALGLILGFLLIGFFIVNWIVSKRLWKPFYKTLLELKKYEIKAHKHQQFESNNILEFNQLNIALNKMSEKIHLDYIQQKEFTENASHEMQTPLAIVKANVTLLMQSSNLKEEEMNQLQVIENTLKRLSALNKTLILLTRIENNQFQDNSIVNLKDVISKTLTNYVDLVDARSIFIENNAIEDLNVKMNSALADIMISNLIQNAIRHNFDNGKIKISIAGKTIEIENTGEQLKVMEQDLFVRFKKNDASKESLGLGLSIVKSIVEHYEASITYSHENGLHKFIIEFK